MATEPRDSFDDAATDTGRRGVHRGPKPKGRALVTFGWAALATGVLVGLGVVGLFAVNNGLQFTSTSSADTSTTAPPTTTDAPATASATPTPTVVPTISPDITVAILNGTTTEGLATRAGTVATDAGWTVGAEANASTSDVTTSTVYYATAADEGAARGLAATLGNIAIAQSTQFEGSQLTAVLGSDYSDPTG